MLNSIRFQCRASKRLMPNFGRLQKVYKSMGRLNYVWRERISVKLKNLENEQRKIQEKAKSDAIQYRRVKVLDRRERIKGLFLEYVDELQRKGVDTEHLHLHPKRERERDVSGATKRFVQQLRLRKPGSKYELHREKGVPRMPLL